MDMITTPSTGLTVEAVLRRYTDAETALTQAAEQLQSLSLARETANDAAASLQQAAASLAALAERAAESTSVTQAAHTTTAAALETASTFLGSTDLSQVNEHVSRLGQAVDRQGVRVDQLADQQQAMSGALQALERRFADVADSVLQLRGDIVSLAARLDRSAQLEAALAERQEAWRRLDAQFTPRQRRKYGLVSD